MDRGPRVTLTLDIGVDYDERSAHVKNVIMDAAKKCPHVDEDPSKGSTQGACGFLQELQALCMDRGLQ